MKIIKNFKKKKKIENRQLNNKYQNISDKMKKYFEKKGPTNSYDINSIIWWYSLKKRYFSKPYFLR